MAQGVELLVVADTDDVKRLMNRIEILSEVDTVEEHEGNSESPSGNPGDFDIGVSVKGVRTSDIEDLLLGVEGVEVTVLK